MAEIEAVAGGVVALIMAVIVAGVILANVNTDGIIGATTTSVSAVSTIAFVAFTLAAVGVIAIVGKYIISIFQ